MSTKTLVIIWRIRNRTYLFVNKTEKYPIICLWQLSRLLNSNIKWKHIWTQ